MFEALIVGPLSRSLSYLGHNIPELSQVIIVLSGINVQVVMEAVGRPQGPELVPGELLDEVAFDSEGRHVFELKISVHNYSSP